MKRWLAIAAGVERHCVTVLLATSLVLVAAICMRGVDLRMHEVLSIRLYLTGFPAAVSTLYHGGHPYVSYQEITEALMQAHWLYTYDEIGDPVAMAAITASNNEILRKTIATPVQSPEQVYRADADDKGVFDLVALSFWLFGPKVQGVYWTVILILLVTVLAFFADYRNRREYCLLPPLVLGGVYAAMPALLRCLECYSLSNPRLIEFLAIIPGIHLALAILDRKRFSWGSLAACAVQTVVIVECVHFRYAAMWVVFTIGGLYLATLVSRKLFARTNEGWALTSECKAVLRSGWVIALMVVGLAGLKAHQTLNYDSRYHGTSVPQHVLWHNIGIGFAVHPGLAEKYNLSIADGCLLELIQKRLEARNERDAFDGIVYGRPGEKLAKWQWIAAPQVYEEEARGVVFDLVRDHPWETLTLFLYHKPCLALRSLAWSTGLIRQSTRHLMLDTAGVLAEPDVASQRALRVRFLDLCWLAVLFAAICAMGRISLRELARHGCVLLLFLAGSMLPTLLTYPIFPFMAVPIFLTTSLFLCVAVTWLTSRFGRLVGSLGEGTSTATVPQVREAA